jgi:hypothetical protein
MEDVETPDDVLDDIQWYVNAYLHDYVNGRIDYHTCFMWCAEKMKEKLAPADTTDSFAGWLICEYVFYEGNLTTEEEKEAMLRLKKSFMPED